MKKKVISAPCILLMSLMYLSPVSNGYIVFNDLFFFCFAFLFDLLDMIPCCEMKV